MAGEAVEAADGTKLMPPEELLAGTPAAADDELVRPVASYQSSVSIIRESKY